MKEALNSNFPQFDKYFSQLDKLARLVEQKAKEINITAIRDYESIWEKHILDSLMCSKIPLVEERLANSKVLDLGTGGGFPGLPLAITHENSRFTLLDATRKKLTAVEEFASTLGLKNVETKWERAEEISKDLQGFDIVVARAVAYLPDLIDLCNLFTKKDSLIVLYKLLEPSEIAAGQTAAESLGLHLKEKYEYGSNRVVLVYSRS